MGASRNKPTVKSTAEEHDNPAGVADLIAGLPQPLKPLVQALRDAIPKADSAITTGIKWNSVSFYCHGWFATINVRAKQGLLVVLHHGAKATTANDQIADPMSLLNWLSADRATVSFTDVDDFANKRIAFLDLIHRWAERQKKIAGQV